MGLSPTTRLVTPMKAGKGGLGDDERTTEGPDFLRNVTTMHFFLNYTGGIVNSSANCNEADYDISVVSYGTNENNSDYWIVRNS